MSSAVAEVLADWDVEAKHPDDFLVDQFHLDAISVHKAIQAVADSWQKPPGMVNDVLDRGSCRTSSDRGRPAQIAIRHQESRWSSPGRWVCNS